MKTIRIRFVDFQSSYDPHRHLIYQWLEKQSDYQVELVDERPDYVVFSVFGDEHLRYNDCVKIFWTGENQTPDFNFCDYAIGFHHIRFGDRYLRYPLYFTYTQAYEQMLTKHLVTPEQIAAKRRFCTFVCSNSRGSDVRLQFLDALSAHKTVDSGGKLRNNVGGPVADKLSFQKEGRFSMAFENTCIEGYTTEKIVESFASCTIPIYYGDPRVAEDFNPDSFINCADYPDFEAVIQRVMQLENNPEAYARCLHAPALNDMQMKEKADEALDCFLRHIFDQSPLEARRYSRDYWAHRLLTERLRQYNAYRRTWYFRLSQFYKNHFYQLSRNHPLLWKVTLLLQRITRQKA